jgi:hypothetical protein
VGWGSWNDGAVSGAGEVGGGGRAQRGTGSFDKPIAESAALTLQVNAVRAAFKAGVPPSKIARHLRISQSNVRKALASDEPRRLLQRPLNGASEIPSPEAEATRTNTSATAHGPKSDKTTLDIAA